MTDLSGRGFSAKLPNNLIKRIYFLTWQLTGMLTMQATSALTWLSEIDLDRSIRSDGLDWTVPVQRKDLIAAVDFRSDGSQALVQAWRRKFTGARLPTAAPAQQSHSTRSRGGREG